MPYDVLLSNMNILLIVNKISHILYYCESLVGLSSNINCINLCWASQVIPLKQINPYSGKVIKLFFPLYPFRHNKYST